ncbi:hypothetical protein OFD18_39315, partial [Escherichia coli]|nr:hypothetical protein [Escherichia coli]
MACRLPIIADATTPPMPQEAGTVNLIARNGAGILLRRPKDVVGIVRSLVTDRSRYAAMRAATAGLTIPNSTEYI